MSSNEMRGMGPSGCTRIIIALCIPKTPSRRKYSPAWLLLLPKTLFTLGL